jgi:hypothetical protein
MCTICNVDMLAVVIAAAAYMAIGILWYGPLFGKPWMKARGMSQKDIEKAKKNSMAKPACMAMVNAVIMAFVIGLLLNFTGSFGILPGMLMGALVWVGFVSTTQMSSVIWENKPVKLYWINAVYFLISLVAMGAIMGAFS